MAAVGATRGARGDGRIVLLQPGAAPGAPWSVLGEIALRGVPRRLALESGRLAVVVEGRREASFGIVDAAPGIKIQTVKMAETPVGLGVSPDGESFVLAAGSALRTYRVDDGRTRTIIPFEEPIVALASQRGVGRMLVALGSRIVAVDPRDKPERGSLPVRAQADLPGPAKSLVWMDGGRAAGALIAQPAAPSSSATIGRRMRSVPRGSRSFAGCVGGRRKRPASCAWPRPRRSWPPTSRRRRRRSIPMWMSSRRRRRLPQRDKRWSRPARPELRRQEPSRRNRRLHRFRRCLRLRSRQSRHRPRRQESKRLPAPRKSRHRP
jgi:hypothetical protein